MRRQSIRPGKSVSKISFVIGILFTFFGVSMIITVLFSPLPIFMAFFFMMWTAIAGFNTYQAYKNGFTDGGMAYYEIDTMDEMDSGRPGITSFEDKLRSLEKLRQDGLLTDEEYRTKRAEVLKEKI